MKEREKYLSKSDYNTYDNRLTNLYYLEYSLSNMRELLSAVKLNCNNLQHYHNFIEKIKIDETLFSDVLSKIKEDVFKLDYFLEKNQLNTNISNSRDEILFEMQSTHNIPYKIFHSNIIFDKNEDCDYCLKINYKWLSDEYIKENGRLSRALELKRRAKERRFNFFANILGGIIVLSIIYCYLLFGEYITKQIGLWSIIIFLFLFIGIPFLIGKFKR
ncbi:MAG: hypothetical protein LBN27_01915 [Prevotellaceae bacterium]|jgi:hypothetical protein|nr:hypothetical protein [Prevotellaceae bacterium]